MSIAELSRVAATRAPMGRRVGDVAASDAPSMALVPLQPAEQTGTTARRSTRPDPCFVAHLIAMAQQSPQTRMLRRAATADVQKAYRSAERSLADQPAATATGSRMRLTA